METAEFTADDIGRKLNNSYFLLPIDGQEELVFVSGRVRDDIWNCLVIKGKSSILPEFKTQERLIRFPCSQLPDKLIKDVITVRTIPEELPKPGFYNGPYMTIAFDMAPARTFRMGVYFDNSPRYKTADDRAIEFIRVQETILEGMGIKFPGIHLGPNNIHGYVKAYMLYKPIFFSLEEALLEIYSGKRVSAALSRAFVIMGAPYVDGLTLYYKGNNIGLILQNHNDFEVHIKDTCEFLCTEFLEAAKGKYNIKLIETGHI